MLRLALKHEKEKGLHFVVKEAREFARGTDFDFENEFDEEMKNTNNAWKLKRIAKEKGEKAIDTARKSKSLRGQYPLRSQKADVDLCGTHQWLKSGGVKAVETEWSIVGVQDHSHFTRNFQADILHNGVDPRCRFCDISTETINHLTSGCTILAPNKYANRHNRFEQYMYWKICYHYNIGMTNDMSINLYLFSGTFSLELTEQYKLTGKT